MRYLTLYGIGWGIICRQLGRAEPCNSPSRCSLKGFLVSCSKAVRKGKINVKEKTMGKMIAFCGINCVECPTFLATQANDDKK